MTRGTDPRLTFRRDRGSVVLPVLTAAIGIASIAAVVVMGIVWSP